MLGTRGSGPHLGIPPVSKASPRVRITERPVESFLLLTSKSLPRLNNIRWDFRPPREDKPRQKADDSIFHFSTSCAAILEREPTQPGGASSELRGQEGKGGGSGGVQNVIKKVKILGKKLQWKGLALEQRWILPNHRKRKTGKSQTPRRNLARPLDSGTLLLYSTEARVQGSGRPEAGESEDRDPEASIGLSSDESCELGKGPSPLSGSQYHLEIKGGGGEGGVRGGTLYKIPPSCKIQYFWNSASTG